jgi:hypothetical protein
MKTWIWPFSLYERIRYLEFCVESLKKKNAELDAQMRAQAIAETGMMVAYTSALSSMAAESVNAYKHARPRSDPTDAPR